jgi:hypothetical protein
MGEFVVIDANGHFLGFAGRAFFREYPDARLFTAKGTAVKAARYTHVLCDVVEDYGMETQRVVATVYGQEGG